MPQKSHGPAHSWPQCPAREGSSPAQPSWPGGAASPSLLAKAQVCTFSSRRSSEGSWASQLCSFGLPCLTFFFFFLFRAVPAAYESSWARGPIGAPAPAGAVRCAGLHHSHICDRCHSLQQHWILNSLSEARDQTHILMDTSRVLNPLSHNRNSVPNFQMGTTLSPQIKGLGKQWFLNLTYANLVGTETYDSNKSSCLLLKHTCQERKWVVFFKFFIEQSWFTMLC